MLLAKIAGILILIWFFITAKNHHLPAIQWAIIGLIGYWLTWWLVTLTLANPLQEAFQHDSPSLILLIRQLPALAAIAVAMIIRSKFLLGSTDQEG